MREFIEKLIERLEEYKDSHLIEHDSEECLHCEENEDDWCDCRNCNICVWDKARAIVKELAEEYKPKTQADKIRSMSDEELAELFAQYSCEDADYTSLLPIKDCKWGTKQEVIDRNLKWLQSEA